jgi:2-(1,2-epoxy-1,2-dihydrophenyl)acetyl-CoA isomerase
VTALDAQGAVGDGAADDGEARDGVVVSREGGVLRLTLDRPERRNALAPAGVRRLVEALEQASTDDDLRVVVLAGKGEHFCSGADWVAANTGGERPRPGSVQRRTALQAHRLIELVLEVQLPVVCAVQGWAAGLGCQLALAADLTVATTSSRFWEPFTQRGFTADSGATWLLPRLVGVARAKELLLLGRELSGSEAAAWGAIHAGVPDDELETATAELVDRLAGAATVAIGLTKRGINRSLQTGLSEAMEAEAVALELSARTADFQEGLRAFTERRPARFAGR